MSTGENGAGVASTSMQGRVDPEFWRDRRVLITGHTGFKGAWLSLWLQLLGARVSGFSLGGPTVPSLYALARVGERMRSIDGDVRDPEAVAAAIARSDPEVVIHMAAQSLVRRSFERPRQTYEINVIGTANVLDAVRGSDVRVLVNVTSDKCYANDDRDRPYTEDDAMGGHDPYSSSKACAELLTAAYRRSFFSSSSDARVATAQAGNVIGGGDWAPDRLVPDVMRAAIAGELVLVRNPASVRPWQHVLNPLSGYLVLAQSLWGSPEHARGWNFGPPAADARPVRWLVERLRELWPGELAWTVDEEPHPHEARRLELDSSRARSRLGWHPIVGLDAALSSVVDWYVALQSEQDMRAVSAAQIEALQSAAPAP
jgi:CDP-glucose 4,6-dehydratase